VRLLSHPELTARLATPYTDTKPATSELLLNGKPTGLIVTGAVLEAALEWQGWRIAFFSDDIPFEEMLHIYMFDEHMALVDAAVLGAMHATGTFSQLSLQPPNTITFHFFGETVWRMVLLDQQEFALPYFSDPRGVRRKFKFFRHFRIEGQPQRVGMSVVATETDVTAHKQAASTRRNAARPTIPKPHS